MAATKDQFLAARPKTISVELPDLGITVNIVKGTMATLRAVQNITKDQVVNGLALILVDDEGNLLFTDQEDIHKLEALMTPEDTNLIMDKWRELNGITKDQIEEAAKNLKASMNADSVSDSPAISA